MESGVEKPVEENNWLPMLDFERQMFLDIVETDGLVITAKGLNDSVVILNILRTYMDPAHLVLVINSSEFEEKFYMNKLKLNELPNTAAEREKTYLNGGVHFVSTRILVVDLLKNKVPKEHITGIVVLRAHSVLESCQEAFALRLYRQSNKTGFIKAFSHSPQCFTFGFAHVEKVMKSLFLIELFLWPRFHGLINQTLKKYQPTVVELHVPISQKTTFMQTCILDIMNYTTKELKKINRTLDLQEITVENCITKKFHKILQSQLDCIWHQLSVRTKELVQDLKIMRSLIIHLIHHDAVSFYSLLSKYRTPEYAKVNSGWILLDSAEQMFKHARSRVFNNTKEFAPEIQSKWKYLSEILTVEIPAEQKKMGSDSKIRILILCQDKRTCSHLNDYLTLGHQKSLQLSALRNNVTFTAPPQEVNSKIDKTIVSDGPNQLELNDDEVEEENLDKTNYILTMSQNIISNITQDRKEEESNDNSYFEPFPQMENMDLTQIETEAPMVFIQTFKNNNEGLYLEDTLQALQPRYIIMYHSDITATRQVELYEARRNREHPLTIFFLMHAQTTEEQSYLTSLRREKQSFELLIEAKSTMVIPSYQDGKSEVSIPNEVLEPETNTRKAGGQDADKPTEKPRIIVDMREFRSDLPALLHKKGFQIDPVTILVGDYILTPDICVERKSLSDLIGSLNSGRLHTQCTQMCRHYTRPMLLIEFDQNRPFNLQGQYTLSSDMSGADIRQNLQLLTIHFPKLKLVWSQSPYATAELFYELKQGRSQPSSETALTIGEDASGDGLMIDRYNPAIYDFILTLPGVNSKNISRIMNKGGVLDDIVKLTKEELYELAGNKSDGEMLWIIIQYVHGPSETNSQNKIIPKNRFGKPMRGRKRNHQ